jgi:hypothetical protein
MKKKRLFMFFALSIIVTLAVAVILPALNNAAAKPTP